MYFWVIPYYVYESAPAWSGRLDGCCVSQLVVSQSILVHWSQYFSQETILSA